jgi:hypothetical protein
MRIVWPVTKLEKMVLRILLGLIGNVLLKTARATNNDCAWHLQVSLMLPWPAWCIAMNPALTSSMGEEEEEEESISPWLTSQ